LAQLSPKFNNLEKSRTNLTAYLQAVDKNCLTFKINESKWSAIQICFHVIKSEQVTILSLNKNLQLKDNLKNSSVITLIRGASLSFVLKSNFKVKAPAIVANMPEDYDLTELMKKWETIRISLKDFLDNFPEQYLNKEIFKHPYAGWLNLFQTLKFLQNHFNHHRIQIINLIEEYKSLN
jgi:DinB superfamily